MSFCVPRALLCSLTGTLTPVASRAPLPALGRIRPFILQELKASVTSTTVLDGDVLPPEPFDIAELGRFAAACYPHTARGSRDRARRELE